MKVQLNVGGEVDIVTGEELAGVAGKLHESIRDLKNSSLTLPIRLKLSGQSDAVPASGIGVAILNPAGVYPGRYASLRAIAIMGADDHTAVGGGTAALYIGSPSNYSRADVAATFATLPNSDQYSHGELFAGPGDVFFVVGYGLTVGSTMVVNGRFDLYPSAAVVAGAV